MERPRIQSGRFNIPVRNTVDKLTREELAKKIKRMRDRDAELVVGIFKNLENPAVGGSRGSVLFGYKAYHNDPYEMYELVDGERYQLPRGVARHLNNNCYYKEYEHMKGEFGSTGVRQGSAGAADGRLKGQQLQMSRKIHRYAFHSLEYMDDDADMMPSGLVEVTVTP